MFRSHHLLNRLVKGFLFHWHFIQEIVAGVAVVAFVDSAALAAPFFVISTFQIMMLAIDQQIRLHRSHSAMVHYLPVFVQRFDVEPGLPQAVHAEQQPGEGVIYRCLPGAVFAIDCAAASAEIQIKVALTLEIPQLQP